MIILVKKIAKSLVNMNILFLDLSTTSSGWSVSDDKGQLLDYGCITSLSTNVFERLDTMVAGVISVFEKYNIQKIIAEEVRVDYQNAHTYKLLTWLQGVILLEVYRKNAQFTYELIQPSEWRSKIGIKTGAGIKREKLKQEDIKYVFNKYGIKANDDICDSICLLDSYFVEDTQQGHFWD